MPCPDGYRLSEEVRCVNEMLALRASRRATFADCAGRYLSAFKGKRAAEVTAWHIRLLLPYIGHLDVHSVHDATLQSFIADRVASGVCATTINRTLEVVRTILVRAARSYRHQDGTPWLPKHYLAMAMCMTVRSCQGNSGTIRYQQNERRRSIADMQATDRCLKPPGTPKPF